MLDAFIIDQIQRRERKDDRLQPSLEQPGRFPMQPPPHREEAEPEQRRSQSEDDDEQYKNGIMYIDM